MTPRPRDPRASRRGATGEARGARASGRDGARRRAPDAARPAPSRFGPPRSGPARPASPKWPKRPSPARSGSDRPASAGPRPARPASARAGSDRPASAGSWPTRPSSVRSGPASQRAATSEPGRSARGADAYERAPRRSGPTRERASVAPRVDRRDGPPARRDGGGRRPFPRRDRTPQDPSFRSRNTSPAALDRLLDSQSWASLRPALEGPGVEVEPAIETLRRYARLLIEWNRSHSNLISHNDEARIVERHLIESVGPASLLKQSACRRWIDFGSGAGLPAIPLIIAGVAGAWTLVESRRTKTLFIRKALQELSLESIEVVNDRLENVVLEPYPRREGHRHGGPGVPLEGKRVRGRVGGEIRMAVRLGARQHRAGRIRPECCRRNEKAMN
ncbi:MAG: hypothetical protein E6K81_04670 [Candidatus Eisenbacteria bacterium]|uniref:Ribosomal RNA small subunit methyltransferase G n=1 Tax=Eiseniibacteriota bacterium TaxID=2212470 RepID=A0A538UBY8_UNCEI|nr:MAG: hypothetical protein E6K81_04670 [Candidatus Eisenbacteria bacterium]